MGKWPVDSGFTYILKMVIFHNSYVSLPEGKFATCARSFASIVFLLVPKPSPVPASSEKEFADDYGLRPWRKH
jgi:hypothetical protein